MLPEGFSLFYFTIKFEKRFDLGKAAIKFASKKRAPTVGTNLD